MKVHRYRGNIQNEAHFLMTGAIYIPAFYELNDPYDGRMFISIDKSIDPRDRIKQALPSFRPNLSTAEEALWLKKINSLTRAESRAYLNSINREEFRKEWKILSFSAKPINELMWSHYSSQHKGICLEFETKKDPLFKELKRVKYAKKPVPCVYPFTDGSATRALLTKSKAWKYEQESRIIFNDSAHQIQLLQKDALTGVIFGLHASEDTKRKIKDWIRQGPFAPHFYQAREVYGTYGIQITPV